MKARASLATNTRGLCRHQWARRKPARATGARKIYRKESTKWVNFEKHGVVKWSFQMGAW